MDVKINKMRDETKIKQFKDYTKKVLRIVVSSLIGIIAGLGMLIVYMFWAMHFIPELAYYDTTSTFPILTIALQAFFILGPQFIAGFISTNVKKAFITAVVVCAVLGSISILLNVIQGIVNIIIIIFGVYLGGAYAEH